MSPWSENVYFHIIIVALEYRLMIDVFVHDRWNMLGVKELEKPLGK